MFSEITFPDYRSEEVPCQEIGDLSYGLNLNKFSQGKIQKRESSRNTKASTKLSLGSKIILQDPEDDFPKNLEEDMVRSRAKLTFTQVGDIKFLLKTSRFNLEDIALQYRVSKNVISNIYMGKTYSHVEIPFELSEEGQTILKNLETLLLERRNS
jgi:hypothetical protein